MKGKGYWAYPSAVKRLWYGSLFLSICCCLAVAAISSTSSHSGHESNVPETVLLDAKHIQRDLTGRSICGWTFEKGTLFRIRILDAEYGEEKALVKISVKAAQHVKRKPGWIGKQGELKLVYRCHNSGWNLMNVEAIALSDLTLDDLYGLKKTDGRPLLIAVDEGDVETVKTLVEEGANVYQRARGGETALMIAAARGHTHVSEVLLKEGLDVNMISADGRTPLMMAASLHRTEMVKFLLKRGADPNWKGPLGISALSLAVEKRPRHQKVPQNDLISTVSALINQGADVNVKDERGCTPLWLALKGGEDHVVQLLLDGGADVNMAAGPSALTPLMEAVAMGRLSLVKILVEKGANVNATKNGMTVLGMAKASQLRCNTKMALIEILEKTGAQE
ncbi:MAG: ankyrin repeat domain-containing protein [Thermodesulfobacteriota bacterium]|nr:ankyrin repeat domain-containing protein [Thermodesulfobacteriota bacterium]